MDILKAVEFSDTEILVGKEPDTKVFKANSLILKIRSPYFRIALSDEWKRIENGIIKLQKPNITVEVFDIIIKYLYDQKIDHSENDIKTNVAILIAADELCDKDLCTSIENYLLDNKKLLERDGFELETFHECCDMIGPTLTVVRVKHTNEILGGFNPSNWFSNFTPEYINTKNSFIFSMDKMLNSFIFSKVVDNNHAIYSGSEYGMVFGDGRADLNIMPNLKKGECYEKSYEKPIILNKSKFKIEDYEVFQVIKRST
ncbi:2326_t:CDS:2 [Funneliformis caledonium]|uniref:2326_t:CDS:1 n=1 Tax=Funneliformis caledonium TaxID=1117310 RepID=A0A9N9CD57_9GLOM|nr:2326_t:CDS:2 [Funneliformis caledonium]